MYITPRILTLIFIFIIISNFSFSQSDRGDFRILFYNVENLFDISNDPLTEDEDFLPDGSRFWNFSRFQNKLRNIAKVISISGQWETPEIIGLCEIENRYVAEQLSDHPLLKKSGYKLIHKESPDERGIDVSLLYKENRFYPIRYKYLEVKNSNDSLFLTRDILYVSGIIDILDTIHVFVNHWPSRYGGYLETVSYREIAATVLRSEIDKLFISRENPKIIILGDFNDQPVDENIVKVLNSNSNDKIINNKTLYNLSARWMNRDIGTIKYQSQWFVYDQIIVSGNLLDSLSGFACSFDDANILTNSFLIEEDRKYGGVKPFRTYTGYKYNGGFSDHLPVYLDLYKK